MRFLVPINEAEEGESVTIHAIETGSTNPRTNKRILRQYFHKMGVPTYKLKYVMREMGFYGKALGACRIMYKAEHETATSTTSTH